MFLEAEKLLPDSAAELVGAQRAAPLLGKHANYTVFVCLLPCHIIPNHGAAFHHEFHGFQGAHVGERVAVNRDDIRIVACLEGTDFSGPAHRIGGVDRGGLNGIDGLHAPLDHFGELFGIVTVGINAGVGGKRHFCACLKGTAKIFALHAPDFLFFLDRFRQHAGLCAFLKNVIVVVNVEVEIGAVLLGKRDAFVVDQAGVLDRIDARANGVFDGLRAVRMRGHFAAQLVRFFSDGLELFEGVLRCAGLVAFAEDSAGSAHLDEVGAVLDDFADFCARRPRTVGDAFGFKVVILVGQKIVVAVTAGDAKRRAGDEHARTFDFAVVDAVAHGYIAEAVSADVANRCETGMQSDASVLDAGDGFSRVMEMPRP